MLSTRFNLELCPRWCFDHPKVCFSFDFSLSDYIFVSLDSLQVVESSASIPDGAYTAFQYFENLRNFCVAIEEMGLPTFEASDLEQVCART